MGIGLGFGWGLGLLADELGVGFQIADQGMALCECKLALGGGLAKQSIDVLEAPRSASQRLVTGSVDARGGVFSQQTA